MTTAAKPMIYAAMAKVMKEVGAIGKGRKNVQQNYAFRGIDDVVAHLQDVMANNGVVVIPRVLEQWRDIVATKSGSTMASVRLMIRHTFYAEDGTFVEAETIGEAMDSGDKASNKAMSAAFKYALTESFMIATYEVDRDTEEQSPELARPSTPQTEKQMSDALRASLASQQAAAKTRAEQVGPVTEVDKVLAAIREAQTEPALNALTSRIKRLSLAEQKSLRAAWGDRRDELRKTGAR